MTNKRLLHWCQSVLPANYRSVRELTDKYQKFLSEQLGREIAQNVQVIKVDRDEIVIASASSQVAGFLRIHGVELRQQFCETFGGDRKIVVRTMPDSLLQLESRQPVNKPRPVSDESVESIKKNADWIEDENLRKALKSLAGSLKKT